MEVHRTSSIAGQTALIRLIITTRINLNSWCSKILPKNKWLQTQCNSTVIRKATTLRIASFFSKCLGLTTNLSGQCLRTATSRPPSRTSGTSCGAHLAAKATYMRVSTSIRKLTISLRATKSQEKIGSASTLLGCRRDLVSSTLTSCQTPISCLMSSVNFMNTTKN